MYTLYMLFLSFLQVDFFLKFLGKYTYEKKRCRQINSLFLMYQVCILFSM